MSAFHTYAMMGIFVVVSFMGVQTVPQSASGQEAKASSSPTSAPAGGTYHLPESFKIVCIGDSISQGRKGKGDGMDRQTFSWRYPFWKMLVDLNVKADFVGSLNGGFNGDPDWADYKGKKFPRPHEAYWGWPASELAKGLPEWLEKYTPDAALLMLDDNGKAKKTGIDQAIKDYTGIIESLRKKNPKVLILLGIPYQEWEPFPAMRQALTELAGKLTTPQAPIVIVDSSKGWVSDPKNAGTCTVDWVHPNEKGDEIVARKFMEALKPFLAK